MKNLVFATGNSHKLQEVQGLFKEGFALSCLKDVNITEEIPETADNLVVHILAIVNNAALNIGVHICF